MSVEALSLARKIGATGKLSSGALLTLWMLADHADESFSCFPGQDVMALESAQTERSVRRHLNTLRDIGVVRTTYRTNAAGARIGLRYFLDREGMQQLAEEGRQAIAKMRDFKREDTRENTGADNLSGRTKTRENTGADNLSGRASYRTNPAKTFDPHLKERARINHQIGSDRIGTDPMILKAKEFLPGWTESEGPASLMHRGVVLSDLAEAGAELHIGQHPVMVWREVVDVILNRTDGSTLKSATRYVVASFSRDPHGILAMAMDRCIAADEGSSNRDSRTQEEPKVRCEKHDWSGRSGLVCPACRADHLAGDTDDEDAIQLTPEQIEAIPEQYRSLIKAAGEGRTTVLSSMAEVPSFRSTHTEDPPF